MRRGSSTTGGSTRETHGRTLSRGRPLMHWLFTVGTTGLVLLLGLATIAVGTQPAPVSAGAIEVTPTPGSPATGSPPPATPPPPVVVQPNPSGTIATPRIVYLPDSQLLAVTTAKGVVLDDVQTMQPLRMIDTGSPVTGVAFTPDGATLAAGLSDGSIQLFDVNSGQLQSTIQGPAAGVTTLTFSPDGLQLAGGSADNLVRIWQVSDGQLLQTLQGHSGPIESIAFAPDGSLLVSGSADGSVRLWRVSDGSTVSWVVGAPGGVTAVAFSPDSADVAFGAGDGTVRLWQTDTGKITLTLSENRAAVTDVAFAPDGATVASSSTDGAVRVWQLSDGQLQQTFQDPAGAVSSIAFRPDGSTLTAIAANGQLRSWPTSSLAAGSRGPGLASPQGAPPIVIAPPVPTPPRTNNAAFVSDVTVPDYAFVAAGAPFDKTWRLRNDGTLAWGSGYSLAFVSGDRLGAPASVALPATAPGQSADVTVPMVAPTTPGTYRSVWRLIDPSGQPFGSEVWALIQVPGQVLPPLPPPAAYAPQAGITASSTSISAGGAVNVQAWVQNVKAAWVNGDPVVNNYYQKSFALCGTTTFTLDVELTDGQHIYRAVTVNVSGSCS